MKSDAVTPTNPLPATHTLSSGSQRPAGQAVKARNADSPTTPELPPATEGHALFLDVDGTLLSIAEHPDAVQVSAELLTLLDTLNQRLCGAVALVSGRTIADLDGLFSPLRLTCAGVHGLERRGADGTVHEVASAGHLDPLRAPLTDFVKAREGLLLEDKHQSLALHYRNAPQHEAEIKSLLADLMGTGTSALELKRGKMVVEVKPAGANKGTAIEAFMEEAPFVGRIPVFIGDDVTDEDGFSSVNQMGGLSIRVGFDETSAATFTLPDEDAVMAWLQPWAAEDRRGGAQ